MELYEIILIGIALSIDACALTIANCATYKKTLTIKNEWSMPIAFAIFQGVMPLIGYYIGYLFSSVIGTVADYITAVIFFVLAIKIVIDILKEKKCSVSEKEKKCNDNAKFTLAVLLVQALATSIDALAVGVTLINLTFSVYIAVAVIAVVTFIFVSVALIFGKSLGKLFGGYAEWLGAIILFILATKSLIEAIV